ncbi:DMT family transporter [Luteithermobacter gelatinilyticus]|uniref:DMT family transporter n=1 Tax=Luteithermobacter gelatinilyticus TaxID=2582913 RepID=UPI001105AB6F|nr:DMT family transporter [Luteithermobacter gelatinilyticus]
MSLRLTAYLGLTTTILCWAGNYIAASLMNNTIPPITGNFWRWGVAALILLPLTYRTLLEHKQAILRAWKYVLFQAALSISIFNALLYLSAHSAAVISLNMIQTFSPVATFFLAWLVLGKKPSRHQLAGLAVAFIGIMILLSQGTPGNLLSIGASPGNLWMLLAVFCWGLYSVLLIKNPLTELPPLAFLTVLVVAGLALMVPFYIVEFLVVGELS